MLKTIIIEDEKPALENLLKTLSEVAEPIQIEATFSSVKESISNLPRFPEANIIFSDVKLPDGLSFEIFSRSIVKIPVIFITGYDDFMLNAFEYNGIDYLLKPVSKPELDKALSKYQMLEKHFSNHSSITNLVEQFYHKKKTRLIVKKGLENISLRLEDVVLFYTENKIVYAIDKWNKKYLVDKNLGELEGDLDGTIFFRANRQFILNINFIKGYKPYEKVKLVVDLTLPDMKHCIIISQETAPSFRKWIYEA